MKTLLIRYLALWMIVAFLPGCEEIPPQKNEPATITLRKKMAEIIRADQEFAFELFREVYSNSEEENIMISPLSVSYALGMTLNGAAGTTLEAFRNVLHFEDLTDQEVNESYKDLMDQLVHLDDRVLFTIANSIWYRMGFEVLEEFIKTNQDYFDAAVKELDFSDPKAVEIINKWIEDKTNGKIKDMLDEIPPDAVMYLINAIYFRAKWKYRFDPDDTFSGSFHLEDGTTHPADFMSLSGSFAVNYHPDFTSVELPYGDSTFSMVVILPDEGKKVSGIVEQMDETTWESWLESAVFRNIIVELPRFRYGFKDLLNKPLINLGLGIAFSGAADFSRIHPLYSLFISRVIHQTFIDVKEEGTEAAAATIVEIELSSGPPVFRADRTFLYCIRENSTGALLFMGKVGKPEYE